MAITNRILVSNMEWMSPFPCITAKCLPISNGCLTIAIDPFRFLANIETWRCNRWETDKPFTTPLWKAVKIIMPKKANRQVDAGRQNVTGLPCPFDNRKVCRYDRPQCQAFIYSCAKFFLCAMEMGGPHGMWIGCFDFRITLILDSKRFVHRKKCGNWSKNFGMPIRTTDNWNNGALGTPTRK